MTEAYHRKKLREMAEENIEAILAENESLRAQVAEQSDALVELAEIIEEGMSNG